MLRGEVWWVEFDPSVGSEIRKTRPAVIVSNDTANRYTERVVVVPMTADKRRLKSMLCRLSNEDMRAVEDVIRVHLGLPL